MKKIVNLILAAIIVATTFSCKKGENDPGMSLKSRKSRLVGEWKLASSEMTVTENEYYSADEKNHSTVNVEKFDGTNFTESDTYPLFKSITTAPYQEYKKDTTVTSKPSTYTSSATIVKDGTYTSTSTKVTTEDITDDTLNMTTYKMDKFVIGTLVTTENDEETGVWMFVEGNKQLETGDKEGFIFQLTKSTEKTDEVFTPNATGKARGEVAYTSTYNKVSEYTGKDNPFNGSMVTYIDQLKSKEMIVVTNGKYNYTGTTTSTSGSTSVSTTRTGYVEVTGTSTYTQE